MGTGFKDEKDMAGYLGIHRDPLGDSFQGSFNFPSKPPKRPKGKRCVETERTGNIVDNQGEPSAKPVPRLELLVDVGRGAKN